MSVQKSYSATDPTLLYCAEHTAKLAQCQKDLLEATLKHKMGRMAGAPEVISTNMNFMRLIDAKKVLDIGTFTGISALAAALAIPEDGRVISMDITDEHYNQYGKDIVEKSGVAQKIDFRIKPASDTLDELLANGEEGTFDFAFIDAYKKDYIDYYHKVLKLLRKKGVIIFDNALLHGDVVNPEVNREDILVLRKVNKMASEDPSVDTMLFNVGDGILIVFKK